MQSMTQQRDFLEYFISERAQLERFARRRGFSQDDAEDIVREALMRVARIGFKPDSHFRQARCYMLTTVTSVCLDYKRKQKTSPVTVSMDALVGEDGNMMECLELSCDGGHTEPPDGRFEQFIVDVTDHIDTRVTILLKFIKGMTYSEISYIQETHPATVKTRIHRWLKAHGRECLEHLGLRPRLIA